MAPSRGPPPLPRKLHATLSAHKGPVYVARYSKGAAKYVLTGGQDRTIRLWNPESALEIKAFTGHGYEVLSISVSHDNSRFASSGGERSAFVWDVTSGVTVKRFAGHLGKINAVEFNEDASVLASGSYDTTVKLWDLRSSSYRAIQSLDDARDSVVALHVGPTSIVTGSVDGHVRTYDLRKGELRVDYIGHPVTSITPTADAQTLLVTSLDSHVRLMDQSNGKLLNDFTAHVNEAYHCRSCFGHGEASIVCGDEEGRVWAWDLLDASPLAPNPPPKVHKKVVTWVEQNPNDPGEIVTASADGTAKVWRAGQD